MPIVNLLDGNRLELTPNQAKIYEENKYQWVNPSLSMGAYMGRPAQVIPFYETIAVRAKVIATEQAKIAAENKRRMEAKNQAEAQALLASQVKVLSDSNTILQTDLQKKAELISQLEQQQASLKTQIETLASEIQSSRETIQSLEAKLSILPDLQNTIDRLQGQIDRLMASQNTLQSQWREVLARLSQMR